MSDTPPAACSAPSDLLKWVAGQAPAETTDDLAVEEPLEIRVKSRAVAVTMRTPGQDHELAAGFLLSEGVIASAAEILRIEPCAHPDAGQVLNVYLRGEVDFARLTRHVFASSSCGVCGKATIDAVLQTFPPVVAEETISAGVLRSLPALLRSAQQTFERTGGLHAAAIFDPEGRLVVVREDVGRHNAVDKVTGHGLLEGVPFDRHALLVSGRTSFEIMHKALAARIPIVAGLSAPSSLAVDFAREAGQTLVGFLREDRMNVYAGPQRVVF